MLTDTIRRLIDAARDALVGKIPDPKGQVDQITSALIYKSMHEMDQAATKMRGGKPSFFVGNLKKSGWDRLLDTELENQQRADLYAENIDKLSKAKHLPPLFQDIFKDAFVPFRDANTISLFLKQIDQFPPYQRNSEDLGSAFEYLLSFMGTQGDAGQFRTPHHIIDFIVKVVAPQKSDKILDPACGTAGFLVSAYKHISAEKPTQMEIKKLSKNIIGVDIDPQMAKIARVNLYLHGFSTPDIKEDDTLTNEDLWGSKYNVILANPPFMTPRGGIQPHGKFAIKANRSEVLFVDYIAEHLRLGGRAGIIVPEGIIFQAGRAYKDLRKRLVNDWGLYAVVSLPNGVFSPYSGVKTSILFLDRGFATDEILFVKVENDGYDLGAQRRKIDKDDLPKALDAIQQWKKSQTISAKRAAFAHSVSKTKIAKGTEYNDALEGVNDSEVQEGNAEYNLAGECYREVIEYSNNKWAVLPLNEIIELNFGTRITKKDNQGTKYPVYGGGGESFRTDDFNRENELVISRFALSEQCVRFVSGQFFLLDSGVTYSIKPSMEQEVLKAYVDITLLSIQKKIYQLARGHAQKNLDIQKFKRIKVLLPPFEVQEQTVAEISGYQRVIDGAKQVVANWQPQIKASSDWKVVTLGELEKNKKVIISRGQTITKRQATSGDVPVIAGGQTPAYFHNQANREGAVITVSGSGAYAGFVNFFTTPIFASDCTTIQSVDKNTSIEFFYYLLKGMQKHIYSLASGMAQPHVYPKNIKTIRVPFPPLKEQKRIVAEIEAEQAAVDHCKDLITKMEQKIADKISEIWGETP